MRSESKRERIPPDRAFKRTIDIKGGEGQT